MKEEGERRNWMKTKRRRRGGRGGRWRVREID